MDTEYTEYKHRTGPQNAHTEYTQNTYTIDREYTDRIRTENALTEYTQNKHTECAHTG